MSERLAARYREQLEVARATLVRVMNEKRNAELGRSTRATFLPSLHFVLQAESKKTQLRRHAHGASGRHARELRARRLVHRRGLRSGQDGDVDVADDDNATRSLSHAPVPPESSVIPYGRVLASRPIEIKSLIARRDRGEQVQTHEPAVDEGESATRSHAVLRWHESPLDVAYASQHLQEHYELPRASALGEMELGVSTALRGSFDSSRARSLRVIREMNQSAPRSEATNESSMVTESPQPHVFAPIKPSGGDSNDPQRRPLPTHRLRVEVVVPEPIPAPASSQEATEPQTSTPIGRRSVAFQDAGPPVSHHETGALSEEVDDDIDAVIDVRQFLMAEMQAAFAPLRSIRLEPSQCKLNSLGKYLPLPVAPTEPSHLQRKKTPRRPGLSTPPAPSATTPSRQDLQQMKRLSGASASVRESRRLAIVLPTFSRWRKQEPAKSKRQRPSPRELEPLGDNQNCVTVVRRQGFLEIAEIPHAALPDKQPQQQQIPTQRRRRYFSIIDDHLLEFSESVDVHSLRHTRPHARHSLAGATLRDAPLPSSLSESDALLRHSFVLSLSLPPTEFLLTAESLMDRKQWMQALREGVSLGAPPTVLRRAETIPNGLPGSPQYRHRHTIAKIIADQHRERRRLTLLNLLGSNAQPSGVDQVLEVDYRIN
ncbi:hypothetical protein PINS_up006236 [Pythium insidiosum]|nr:hypothetical protein PINS_up006236 [Pythium insidiosum]